jgi:hypothetical protein
MISLEKIVISLVVSILFAVGGISLASAQNVDESSDANGAEREDPTRAPSALLKSLTATPASKMDLGLLAAEARLFAYFTVNKPDVLKEERFRFLAADYTDIDGEILVQLSHLSQGSSPDELAAECKQDVELALEALSPGLARLKTNEHVNASEEALFCRKITSMFFGTETTEEFLSREFGRPDDSLCRHIRFYARVSSMKDKTSVHCFKDFFSSNVEITHEPPE